MARVVCTRICGDFFCRVWRADVASKNRSQRTVPLFFVVYYSCGVSFGALCMRNYKTLRSDSGTTAQRLRILATRCGISFRKKFQIVTPPGGETKMIYGFTQSG